jgi:hypothetical protein
LPYFNSIQVIGDLDVQIDGGFHRQQLEVSGRLKNVQAIKMYMKGKTLHIGTLVQPPFSPRVKIRASMPSFNQFSYGGGSGNINIKQLHPAQAVSMNIQGSPRVSINGNVRLHRLIVGGNSQLSIYWINSCDVSLTATDNAKISVAGMVGTLEADAFQCAWINARYLRAERVFVKSYGGSRVDVSAMCALNALASHYSTIYSYQDPRFQAPYMQCAGSVIQMTHLCFPPCDLCDNACCKNGWH